MLSSMTGPPDLSRCPPPTLIMPSIQGIAAWTRSEIMRLATLSCLKSVIAPSSRSVSL